MRFRTLVPLAFGLMIAACQEPTAPRVDTVEVMPAATGWQMIIQSEGGGITSPVAGVRTSKFYDLSTADFYFANSVIFDLKSVEDTVFVGYYVENWLWSDNYKADTVTWSLSVQNAPTPANAEKVKFGAMSFFFETFVEDSNYLVKVPARNYTVTMAGEDDILFKYKFGTRETILNVPVAVAYRPAVCKEFAARSLTSSGAVRLIEDGNIQNRDRYSVGDMKVTCNPKAPTALRATDEPAKVRLLDYILSRRPVR